MTGEERSPCIAAKHDISPAPSRMPLSHLHRWLVIKLNARLIIAIKQTRHAWNGVVRTKYSTVTKQESKCKRPLVASPGGYLRSFKPRDYRSIAADKTAILKSASGVG